MKVYNRNFYDYIILFSLLAILGSELLISEIQYVIALLGIFSLGILHGSNDLFVIENLNSNSQKPNFYKSLFTYLGVVLSFVAVFYFIPIFALAAFVIISSYHFGEQHFHHKLQNTQSFWSSLFFLIYGLLVLFLILSLNSKEVILIVQDMTGLLIASQFLNIVLFISALGSISLFVVLSKTNPRLKSSLFPNVIYLILFMALFAVSNVVWGFASYFVLWHSIPSLKDQVNSLYGTFNFKNFLRYFKKAFPYWLASIIGMLIVVWLFKDSKNFLSLLFAFIAAITFPHVFIMRKLFDKD
ncbi:Brp/Blh family beta-carotene 15,15'-dioxygenase [Psychroflexus sp. MES1-P1E]|uniref:Brp/Blh family beta-carotene 15,15'-dioxygenase n=1 Tax=Psychroflexus sp. MES1-P1E TaxID=2058320 RepID=UPI000C7B20BB|nr:Brp/Blh family beta-carotene 15,15'-dioxygenase [Psychroflexus sp. MES1-P1E]PKG43068.1 beta-carotene 15,15'-monooxygenase [Psychroflexus sp. MES1-P1E]